jgi:hypothetical protein
MTEAKPNKALADSTGNRDLLKPLDAVREARDLGTEWLAAHGAGSACGCAQSRAGWADELPADVASVSTFLGNFATSAGSLAVGETE